MNRLQQFVELLTGSFDNREQYEQMQKEGNQTFPLARHVNTACNDKITGLPQDFDGVFVLEESYYNVGERTNASPHLFCLPWRGKRSSSPPTRCRRATTRTALPISS